MQNNNKEEDKVLTYKEIQMQMKCQIGQNSIQSSQIKETPRFNGTENYD